MYVEEIKEEETGGETRVKIFALNEKDAMKTWKKMLK